MHVWSEYLTELNFRKHSKEPTHRYPNNNRPDIVVIYPQTGHDTELDISLMYAWCSDLLAWASTAGIAASKREEKKEVKYNQELVQGGIRTISFVSLVFEHFGRWGIQASNYLNMLAESSRDDEGKKTRPNSRPSGDLSSPFNCRETLLKL